MYYKIDAYAVDLIVDIYNNKTMLTNRFFTSKRPEEINSGNGYVSRFSKISVFRLDSEALPLQVTAKRLQVCFEAP